MSSLAKESGWPCTHLSLTTDLELALSKLILWLFRSGRRTWDMTDDEVIEDISCLDTYI